MEVMRNRPGVQIKDVERLETEQEAPAVEHDGTQPRLRTPSPSSIEADLNAGPRGARPAPDEWQGSGREPETSPDALIDPNQPLSSTFVLCYRLKVSFGEKPDASLDVYFLVSEKYNLKCCMKERL